MPIGANKSLPPNLKYSCEKQDVHRRVLPHNGPGDLEGYVYCKVVIMQAKTRECANYLTLATVEALNQQEVKALKQSYKLQSIAIVAQSTPRAPQRRLGNSWFKVVKKMFVQPLADL